MKRVLTALGAVCAFFASIIAAAEPYPVDYWAVRAAMSGVELSPDGKYVAFMQIPSKRGNPLVKVYETADLSKDPFVAGGESLEITTFSWISDDTMVVVFRGQVSDKIDGFNQGAYRNRVALLNVESGKFTQLDKPISSAGSLDAFSMGLASVLPKEPNKVLISFQEIKEGSSIRPTSYYEYDLKRGSRSLVLRGTRDVFSISFDSDGFPLDAIRFDEGSDELVYLYRDPGDRNWTEVYRRSEDSFETFNILDRVQGDPDRVYVSAHNGNDKAGLWYFNVRTKTFGDLIYRNSEVDITGLVTHSNSWAQPDSVIGVGYYKDKSYRYYFDTQEARIEEATLKQLEDLTPNSDFTRITSRSRDGNTLVVYNLGATDPGTYYLLANGQYKYLGGRKPLLKAEGLSEVRYIQYPARDGRVIPAFVTVPQGEGPFPLIVLPHGGPFVREQIVFDEWAQLLANNGYMVLQPQYRGSQGYGLDFYTSAFINGGQGGYKMQDDKDDGALYLVQQGLADRNRLGFFGWSYGGYAALIAAARQDQIYQCAIAGAAVADNNQQVNYYRSVIRGAQAVEQLRFWDESISPITEADKVNIPLLMVHGTIDQRVPISHARKYERELKAAGIPYEYIELDDADHFSNTLFYRHKKALYEAMLRFLREDCGPGGL